MPANSGKVITSVEDFFTPTLGIYSYELGADKVDSESNIKVFPDFAAKASLVNIPLESNENNTIIVTSDNILNQASTNSFANIFFLSASSGKVKIQKSAFSEANIINIFQNKADLEFYTSVLPPSNRAFSTIIIKNFVAGTATKTELIQGGSTDAIKIITNTCSDVQLLFSLNAISSIPIQINSSAEADLDRSALQVKADAKAFILTTSKIKNILLETTVEATKTKTRILTESKSEGIVQTPS